MVSLLCRETFSLARLTSGGCLIVSTLGVISCLLQVESQPNKADETQPLASVGGILWYPFTAKFQMSKFGITITPVEGFAPGLKQRAYPIRLRPLPQGNAQCRAAETTSGRRKARGARAFI